MKTWEEKEELRRKESVIKCVMERQGPKVATEK